MIKTRRRTKEKNKKYTRKRKKSNEKNKQTNKTKPIQQKRWVAFWRRVISIYNSTISFLWLQPLFSRRSTEHALAENTFTFQVKSVVHMDGNNRGSTADFICSHCIDYLYLLTHHQIPALVTGHTTVDSVTTWAISHAIRDRQGPFVILCMEI